MAKALFHRGQRVFVKPVGTWATVERLVPHWVKGVEEPIKVLYEVGLGREFSASELLPETKRPPDDLQGAVWRVCRARNRLELENADASHPHPGTFPVVVTDEIDWGGWRVPAAEYERHPQKIEHQALVIANAQKMLRIIQALTRQAESAPLDVPPAFHELVRQAQDVLSSVYEPHAPSAPPHGHDARL